MRASDLSESDKQWWGGPLVGPPGPGVPSGDDALSACGAIQEPDAPREERVQGDPGRTRGSAPPLLGSSIYLVCEMAHWRGNIPSGDFAYLSALMSLNRIHMFLGRFLAVWIAVAGLMAAERSEERR